MRGEAVYRALLLCYPAAFRREYGEAMLSMFADQLVEARRGRDPASEAMLWMAAAADVALVAPKEHGHVIRQDVRYALRTMAASPGFTAVAILTLALGIGANTAIYSLWNGVLHAALAARAPEQLVMLTDPSAAGVSIGSQQGDRALLTYAEFEQLRDQSGAFQSLMASESALNRWQVRMEGGEWEEAQGRMVSGAYFETLGVAPAMGRLFTAEEDRSGAANAVISYDYWQSRFGGRVDILGKALTIRKAPLTIIGVASREFHGETSGERPDLWVPLRMQAGILPGRDWLHDVGPDKVMWLHVFGRLQPGVSLDQAQAKANSVFQAGIAAHYGSIQSEESKRQFLDQRLKLRAAAGGASSVRGALANPLRVLMAAAGMVLLIACANLANLLLARGAGRRHEMALRLSLGASRTRLVRQLMTESLILAVCGGVAGIAAAYLLHRGLVRLIAESEDTFQMAFGLEPRVLLFSVAMTCGAALLFGLLPSWLATRAEASESLKGQVRTATGGAGQMRWGRLLVVVQLALSLPLLGGAGLLLRTLHNLQQVELGYVSERLLVVGRVDAQTAGYEKVRRQPLFERLLREMQQVPGVRAASYSENGLFSGRDSGDQIEVEGYTPKGKNDRGSRWDQVGPGYFSTLGATMLAGRDITEADHAGSLKVCVINEAFAKLFFAGRNPLGMHITTVYGDIRNTHQIVGVARDTRSHNLRGNVPPRYFVPVTQPLAEFDGVVFLIRTASEPDAVLRGVQQAIRRVDGSLPMGQTATIEERVSRRVSRDRILARLAVAFGLVAVILAAVGLYGVLSYGVARRKGEIGIRMAMGAEPATVTAMILRETGWLVAAGLVVGAGLTYWASRLIASQLYGLAPHDPPTMAAAVALLLAVALAAAYVPAWRASRMDPMAALRQE